MSEVTRCRSCGAFVQTQDRFCWSCGLPLDASASPPARPQARPPESDRGLDLRRAHLAHTRGQREEAEEIVRAVLAADPESVPALSLLSQLLRERGDAVGAVEASQRVVELAAAEEAPPGAVQSARDQRVRLEQDVVSRFAYRRIAGADGFLSLFATPSDVWYQTGKFYLALSILGLAGLFLALVTALAGNKLGYLWFAASIFAAGWCYHDAESRGQSGLLWGPLVLCLGPFGLAIYLLTKQ